MTISPEIEVSRGASALTYAVEDWREFYPEAAAIFQRHWEEIALDRDSIKFSLDITRYQAMADSGILHVLAARCDFQLVGYYVAFVLPHIHYQEAGLMAFTDIYYLLPEFRHGSNGVEFFVEAEESLKAKGVVKAYLSTKVHKDMGSLFEKLGWRLSDRCYTKLLSKGVDQSA